jgi:hypothetical protein
VTVEKVEWELSIGAYAELVEGFSPCTHASVEVANGMNAE